MENLLAAEPDDFDGGLSANNYATITEVSASTANRDLQYLVDIGALKKHGERKGTRYYLNLEPAS